MSYKQQISLKRENLIIFTDLLSTSQCRAHLIYLDSAVILCLFVNDDKEYINKIILCHSFILVWNKSTK